MHTSDWYASRTEPGPFPYCVPRRYWALKDIESYPCLSDTIQNQISNHWDKGRAWSQAITQIGLFFPAGCAWRSCQHGICSPDLLLWIEHRCRPVRQVRRMAQAPHIPVSLNAEYTNVNILVIFGALSGCLTICYKRGKQLVLLTIHGAWRVQSST